MMTRLASVLSLCCLLSAACTNSGLVLSNVDQASSAVDMTSSAVDMTSSTVDMTPAPDFASSSTDGVQCGSARCDLAAGNVCCLISSNWTCIVDAPGSCGASMNFVHCSDNGDCLSGEKCCVSYDFSGDYLGGASCHLEAECPTNHACRVSADCPVMGTTCKPLPGAPWLSTCRSGP